MGYCINQVGGNFDIKAGNVEAAAQALRDMPNPGKDHWPPNRYSWMSDDWQEAGDLSNLLDEWRWEADVDHDNGGAIIGLNFHGEKAGDDLAMFQAIAPHVEPGSYVEMTGEEGERWRWTFDGETCKEVQANISF